MIAIGMISGKLLSGLHWLSSLVKLRVCALGQAAQLFSYQRIT